MQGYVRQPEGSRRLSPADGPQIDTAELLAVFEEHQAQMLRFAAGILHDADGANDVVQTSLARAMATDDVPRAGAMKAWLFRIVYHCALEFRRKSGVRDRAWQKMVREYAETSAAPYDSLVRAETVDKVREAIQTLPPEQQHVVHARMYEEKTFAEIASELGLPLGTVLTRMRLALGRLKRNLENWS